MAEQEYTLDETKVENELVEGVPENDEPLRNPDNINDYEDGDL